MNQGATALIKKLADGQRAKRFIAVGCINTAVDFALFNLLFYELGYALLLANLLAWLAAFSVGFLLNRNWTFARVASDSDMKGQFLRYLLTAGSALLLASASIWLAALIMPAWLAKIVAIGITFVWSFTLSRLWVWPH